MASGPPVAGNLDVVRIGRLARSRRLATRVRGLFGVAAVGCIAGAAQMALNIVAAVRAGSFTALRGVIEIPVFLVLLVAAVYLFRRAMRVAPAGGELSSALTGKPDFSTLSDGSQLVEHLRNVR